MGKRPQFVLEERASEKKRMLLQVVSSRHDYLLPLKKEKSSNRRTKSWVGKEAALNQGEVHTRQSDDQTTHRESWEYLGKSFGGGYC